MFMCRQGVIMYSQDLFGVSFSKFATLVLLLC
ncbi:hypothetical protein MHEC_34010 [Mycobacterium heckeshornense]|uniref:Uncharacterized protein n=1 Tax=Mycobacterium heckeshornense TaxID=110505 RepID=A0A7R7GUT6_9MYCO|nr:hypothetical protein MHEC_27490 [Mycobacterium heckeshornense]BCO36968.1 hypothetical protein MHEC_34010 [Mycobacterium heckeshornense]